VRNMNFIPGNSPGTSDDMLMVSTLGRGVWTVDASDVATASKVEITGGPGTDTVTLQRDPMDPSILDVYVNSISIPTHRMDLASLASIVFNGAGGDDVLVVDSSYGAISVPGGITYAGGAQTV